MTIPIPDTVVRQLAELLIVPLLALAAWVVLLKVGRWLFDQASR